MPVDSLTAAFLAENEIASHYELKEETFYLAGRVDIEEGDNN